LFTKTVVQPLIYGFLFVQLPYAVFSALIYVIADDICMGAVFIFILRKVGANGLNFESR
jgi:hypothetical protein